jgi:phosphoglycolate phosphatase
MTKRFDAVMFDLDGTLADTLADIAAAGNHAITQAGQPALPVSEYRYLAGQGALYLVEEALGPELKDQAERYLAVFRKYQLAHGLDHTAPYPGIAELLDALTQRGLKLAVLSNKSDAATRVAVQQVLGRWRFDAVAGQRDNVALKPDPAAALAIARDSGVPSQRWLYVGDTDVDMQTANAAGMFAAGVLWGFRDEAELRVNGAMAIVRHPLELLELLD